jgi:hypothetical protein
MVQIIRHLEPLLQIPDPHQYLPRWFNKHFVLIYVKFIKHSLTLMTILCDTFIISIVLNYIFKIRLIVFQYIPPQNPLTTW